MKGAYAAGLLIALFSVLFSGVVLYVGTSTPRDRTYPTSAPVPMPTAAAKAELVLSDYVEMAHTCEAKAVMNGEFDYDIWMVCMARRGVAPRTHEEARAVDFLKEVFNSWFDKGEVRQAIGECAAKTLPVYDAANRPVGNLGPWYPPADRVFYECMKGKGLLGSVIRQPKAETKDETFRPSKAQPSISNLDWERLARLCELTASSGHAFDRRDWYDCIDGRGIIDPDHPATGTVPDSKTGEMKRPKGMGAMMGDNAYYSTSVGRTDAKCDGMAREMHRPPSRFLDEATGERRDAFWYMCMKAAGILGR